MRLCLLLGLKYFELVLDLAELVQDLVLLPLKLLLGLAFHHFDILALLSVLPHALSVHLSFL